MHARENEGAASRPFTDCYGSITACAVAHAPVQPSRSRRKGFTCQIIGACASSDSLPLPPFPRVRALGATTVNVWTVIYRASGYVGAITMVGRTTTRSDVAIARMACDRAQHTFG